MPFPAINECLVCEFVRAEEGGKLSLLGFFGIAPNVEISVQNLDLPIPNLAFVFLGAAYQPMSTDLPFEIQIRVSDPQDGLVFETPPVSLTAPSPGNRTTVAASIGNVRVRAAGRYRVSLLVNGQPQTERTFDIRVRPSVGQQIS